VASPDPRLVYARTASGQGELASPSRRLTPQARRLLFLIDGQRSLAHLPLALRPSELPAHLDELLTLGLVALSGIRDSAVSPDAEGHDPRLEDFKHRIAGMVERELGEAARILEARLQDCVNLSVMRTVMRDVIECVHQRSGPQAGQRLAAAARAAARAWTEREPGSPPVAG
jgi:hypothetical protein